MKKQARDIAKTSNGKVVLVAADELKVTSSFYGSIFAEKEKINGKTEYSKIPISLLEVGGSKKNVTFYLDVDQAEYLYEFAKSFGDCSYSSCKKNEAQKLKRTLLVRRQSFYNNQPKKYPWYLEIEVTKNEKKEKSCINMTDEGFFTFLFILWNKRYWKNNRRKDFGKSSKL